MKKILCILCTLLLFTGCQSSTNQIHIYVRDPSSGTREAFEKGTSLAKVSDESLETSSNDDMVNQLEKDINGIGYVSYATDVGKHQLKVLTYEGIEANVTNILNGSYPLQRPFAFITRAKDDFTHYDKEQLISAFIDYLMYSSEAKLCITHHGGIVDGQGIPWEQLCTKYPVLQKDNSHITIVTAGSTSVEPTLRACLESFAPLAGNVNFVMNHSGSSDAYKRVLGKEKDGPNKADIGFVSRLWKETENNRDQAMLQGIYCYDAVLLVTHQANKKINNLSKNQVQKIYDGTYQQWKELYEES